MAPRPRVLGIDPANVGCAVLRDSRGEVIGVFGWRVVTRGGRKRYECRWARVFPGEGTRQFPGEIRPPSTGKIRVPKRAGALATQLARTMELKHGDVIACEDTVFSRNAKVALLIGRFSGGLVSVLEETVGDAAVWVKPDEWRARVLGTRRATKREVVKAASLKLIPARMPTLLPLLRMAGLKLEDHATDATGVSEWARSEIA